ncbi:hypothetical protein EJ063_20700, partial [Vibrio aquaticus]
NADGEWVDVPTTGLVTVPAGEDAVKVRVKTAQDKVYEGDEDFSVTVEGAEGALTAIDPADKTADATIQDGGQNGGDDDRPTVSIAGGGDVSEGDKAHFTVSLSKAADIDVTVKLTLNEEETEPKDIKAFQYKNADG